MEYVGIIVVWTVAAVAGVNVCHWMGVEKGWYKLPDWVWTAALFTVFLPWTVLAHGLAYWTSK